ncbi:hypothetical protein [Pseudonocardia endophytica]|uniref:5-deoxy-glucuronate isomerase n=1 Tax=Pseudonocardia endophytica TaxID=401976 RepID=A0A4V2PIV5_PSEEN|nr:hypothetical protein [Pseudonocardia endophytica]TCK25836.1 hypothetical protein EV378_1662 [Pseudonocardia endophytica]
MYDPTDPRSALAPQAASRTVAPDTPIATPTYAEFDGPPAHDDEKSGRTWAVRGQNFVLTRSVLTAGQVLDRDDPDHEHVVLLTDAGAHVAVEAAGESREIRGVAMVVVPPGASLVRACADTEVVRLFDHRTTDVAALAVNAAEYVRPHARVATLEPWPAPPGGDRLRVYRPDDVPAEPGRFGRIYRTRSFMVNFLDPYDGPRPRNKLSPHHHDDFQQCSLAVGGEFEHHIRTPWTPDMDQWHPDEHRTVGSPSATIIPPPTVHTTRACGPGRNQLIDIFSPPRTDFSERDGWVLNAADYPAPWEVTR